eukprot:7307019-Prymnesium_polylepis.1
MSNFVATGGRRPRSKTSGIAVEACGGVRTRLRDSHFSEPGRTGPLKRRAVPEKQVAEDP